MTCTDRSAPVARAMITDVKVHGVGTTVGELRAFFADDHVHSAVLVDAGRLLAVVERSDLHHRVDDDVAAVQVGRLAGRVIGPAADAELLRRRLGDLGRRRLAVVDAAGQFIGLLCLKRSGAGFCSDRDVRARAAQRAYLSAS